MALLRLVLICLLLFSTSISQANEVLYDMIKNDKTIRGTSLGNAIMSFPRGTDAISYNPAGLNNKKVKYISQNLDHKKTEYSLNHIQSFVLGKMGYSEERKSKDGYRVDIKSYGIGIPTEKKLAWGMTYKDISYTTPTGKANGHSIDFGILSPLSKEMIFGLMIRDIFKENVTVPTSIGAGITMAPANNGFTISTEAEYYRYNQSIIYKLGMEYDLSQSLVLRLGYNDKKISAGGSFVLPLAKFEYAVITGTSSSSETIHQLGMYIGK